jgi:hypothetical protein
MDPGEEKRVELEGKAPAIAIVEVIAEIYGVDETALAPLEKKVDADALNVFFESGRAAETMVSFLYEGFRVTVTADGWMTFEKTP